MKISGVDLWPILRLSQSANFNAPRRSNDSCVFFEKLFAANASLTLVAGGCSAIRLTVKVQTALFFVSSLLSKNTPQTLD